MSVAAGEPAQSPSSPDGGAVHSAESVDEPVQRNLSKLMHKPDGLTDAQRGHLSETELTEQLDEGGLLDAARGPGCYALRVDVPDDRATVCEQWDGTHDARPPDGTLAQLATVDDVAYVGASGHVYDRLCDHAAGDVRTVSLLSVFDPTAVIDVWPDESPFAWEYNCAKMLAQQGWTVWCNGEVVG